MLCNSSSDLLRSVSMVPRAKQCSELLADIRIEDCGPAAWVTLLLSRAFPGLDHYCSFLLTETYSSSLYQLPAEAAPSPVGEVKTSSQRTCSLKELLFFRGGRA